jgi:hypothetical protein
MLQSHVSAADHGRPPSVSPIQFCSVEIAPLADGRISIGMTATMCESAADGDFELVSMDMAAARVESIDQALAVIRDAFNAATAAIQ